MFHFESVNARFDNLFGSPWLNLKVGKFELDNIVSEKRGLTLSGSGGGFQLYHFIPVGDSNFVGQIGDNQFGLEWMGHSANDRTRISASLLNSSDGNVDLPGSNSYTGFFAGSQAFELGKLGTQRVGFYAMVGQAPTNTLTSGGEPIPGGGFGNKNFSREGFNGIFYLRKLDFQVVTQHGSDNAYFATATAVPGSSPGRRPIRGLEWGVRRDPLRVQPAARFHSAFRVDANVAAGDSWHALQSGQHRQLCVWIQVHAHYEQPGRIRYS